MNYYELTWVVLLILCMLQHASSQQVSYLRLKKLADTSFDKRRPPPSDDGRAQSVTLGVHIHELLLDDSKLTMTIDADVHQSWTDKRLSPVTYDTADLVLYGHEVSDLLWTPELLPRNTLLIPTPGVSDPRRMVVVSKNGRVNSQHRLYTEVLCPNFTSHLRPLKCNLQLQIYRNINEEVSLEWDTVTLEPQLSVPGYTLIDLEANDCTQTTPVGSFACKQLTISSRQDVSFFATEIYGASFLLVLLSWIGFWIDGSRTFVRLALGLSIVIILILYGIGFRLIHRKIGVPGSVEIWISFCILFVLATLVEFAFVHILLLVAPLKLQQLCCRKPLELRPLSSQQSPDEITNFLRAARVIDVVCGLLFPIIFVVFNFVYWSNY